MKNKMMKNSAKWKKVTMYLSSIILSLLILNILSSLSIISTLEEIETNLVVDTAYSTSSTSNELISTEIYEPISADTENWTQVTTLYDQAESFFDDSYVHEIKLYFENDDWYDELLDGHANDPDDPYFPATFVYDDIEIDPIGINFKGHSSFSGNTIKKSFRIDFNYYDSDNEFFGLKKLNLNNGHMDPTMLREKIFWDFAGNYVEVVRCTYTRVYVNDEYFGLYTAIEHIDDEFIESRYGSKEDGNLFRAETAGTLNYLGESADLYETGYELKTNENENDYSGLITLTDVLTNTPTEDLQEEIEQILDVEDTLYCMALLNIFSSLDSYLGSAHNFYLYESDETGLFTHILWDANEAFGRFTFGLEDGQDVRTIDPFWTPTTTSMGIPGAATATDGSSGESSIDNLPLPPGDLPPGGDLPGNEFADLETNRPLFERLLEIDSFNATYVQILAEMIRDGFNEESMSDRIQELADMIRDDIYEDPNKVYTNEQFELTLTDGYPNTQNIFGLESFIDIRFTYLDEVLDGFAKIEDVQLNEMMIDNTGIISDEMNEFKPWIEIYNLGSGSVNLEDLYLSNDAEIPNKWAFPNYTLDDGGFYLIWADGEDSEGVNHLSFTLDENGGNLFLFAESDLGSYTLIDDLTYPALMQNCSYGKYPDGNGEWQEMDDYPTPNDPNAENSLIVKLPTTLYINEIMASNANTIEDPDDPGDYSDWIELYNSGNDSIDLSGMYLTDFLSDPTIWQFPEGTTIDSHSFLIIWADNEPDQGNLHAAFKLSSVGEEIGLISNDGLTIIDAIQFSDVIQDFSIGRIPDGSDNIDYLISTPTPSSENANLESIESTTIQTGLFFVFLGSLIGLTFCVNYFHKKTQLRHNGEFWLSSPTAVREITENTEEPASITEVIGGN